MNKIGMFLIITALIVFCVSYTTPFKLSAIAVGAVGYSFIKLDEKIGGEHG